MSGGLNQVQLIGRLGADPEVRSTRGDDVANFSLATSEKWRDKASGEQRETTEWHKVVAWGPLAKVAKDWLKKGAQIFVQGKLQTRSWEDQHGTKRYTTEVVLSGFQAKLIMLGGGERADERDESTREAPRLRPREGDDDEIPF